jgi:hypothetical protein
MKIRTGTHKAMKKGKKIPRADDFTTQRMTRQLPCRKV